MRHWQSLATISASSPPIKSPNTETPWNKGPEIIQNIKEKENLIFDPSFLQLAAIVWGASSQGIKIQRTGPLQHTVAPNEGG